MKKAFTLAVLVAAVIAVFACTFSHAEVRVSDRKTASDFQRKSIHLEAESVTITEGGTGTNAFGGKKIFDFEEGRILVHGVTASLYVDVATNLVNDGSGINVALGTTTAIATTGAVAHTSTRVDLLPNVEVDPWTNGATAFQSALAASAQFDGTSTAKDMYLNLLIDDGDISTGVTAYVTGDIEVLYSLIGDY